MITRYVRLLILTSFADARSSRRTSTTAKRSERNLWLKLVSHALTGSLLVMGAASPILAATDHVTSLADDSSPGTLRSVLAAADPGDTIVFNVTGTITLIQGHLEINKTLIVSGPGAAKLFISGGDTVSVLQIDSGVAVVIYGITIEHGYASLAGGGGGGGIDNKGALALVKSVVSDNLDGDDGSDGEGIYNSGILALFNSTLSDNFSSNDGAGIYNTGTLAVVSSTVSNNGCGLPGASGGGIFNSGSGTVTMSLSTVSGNVVHDGGQGGGIYNNGTLTVLNSTLSDNDDFFGQGAGIYNTGSLKVLNSTLSGNSAIGDNGGAIVNSGVATVTDSTLSSNSATDGGWGGAIYNEGMLTLVNSTLSSNSTTDNEGDGRGGAIYNGGGTVAMSFSTLSGNSANEGGGIFNSATLILKSTLLAGQTSGGNCYNSQTNDPSSQGYNLADDDTCSFLTQTGDQNNNSDAGLSPSGLQNNGGPTQTIALLPTSSAANAIPVTACTDTFGSRVTTDQRGVRRPQGPACDIGAYEIRQNRLRSLSAPR